ncbi:hypothetical protein F4780DRAFT_517970 [Xylariomycetidae sp. FL0641]|nr:hypothetical protein F4780DRAFT_517970 [Xylariomycetidae sp. FL0641]
MMDDGGGLLLLIAGLDGVVSLPPSSHHHRVKQNIDHLSRSIAHDVMNGLPKREVSMFFPRGTIPTRALSPAPKPVNPAPTIHKRASRGLSSPCLGNIRLSTHSIASRGREGEGPTRFPQTSPGNCSCPADDEEQEEE